MSNIYDEALETLDKIRQWETGYDYFGNYDEYGTIKRAIEHAKKVSKLLELYRKTYQPSVLHPLNEQIKALEEELK